MESGIHWFDLATIVVLILSGIWSLFRGFLREMLSLLGFVVVVVLAVYIYPHLYDGMEGVVNDSWVRQVLSLALLFIAAVAAFVGFIRLGALLTHAMGLSILDRVLGFGFGLVKVVVLFSLLFVVGNKFLPDLTAVLTRNSLMGPTFGLTAGLLERTIAMQNFGVFEESPVTLEQLPTLPESQLPDLPEVIEPYVGEAAPENGAPAPETQ